MVRASLIRKLESVEDPKLRDVFISFLEETERIIGETVRRSEFLEFVKTTNENFEKVWEAIDRLTEKIGELAEAQKKLEERVDSLAQRVEELAIAQRRTEERLESLARRVEELAIAQKKLEERVDNLARRVEELAIAQKKTEERLEKLIGEHQKTREHLGGLSNAFGYVLEDRAIKGLPAILKERYNIEITEPLKRDILETPDGREIELNIFGKGRLNGKVLTIIGECKSQMRKRDVDKFLNYVKMLDRYLPGEKFLVLVAYQAPLKIRKYIEEKGIHLVFSYELPLA